MAKRKMTAGGEAKASSVLSYKGFDKNFQCRGFQYEVGKSYNMDGNAIACQRGFHACENPMDVFSYYLIADGGGLARFAQVEQSGEIARHEDDSKIASTEITIKAEIRLPEIVKAAVNWMLDAVRSDENVQAASGDYSQLAASGDSSQLAASGDSSQLAASGDYSQLAASGHSSRLAASGHYSRLAASGNYSRLAASGHSSQLAASGDYSQLAASGDSSQLAASGDSSRLAASGDYSQLAASGHYSRLAASGKNSVIAAGAPNCTASGAMGTHIALAEFDGGGKCIGFAIGKIGEGGLEPDVAYRASGGKLVKA